MSRNILKRLLPTSLKLSKLMAYGLMAGLILTSPALAAGSTSKKSAFGPGEHELQLPPIWVPVNKSQNKSGPPQYAPISVFLTSKDGGMMNMCYRLPYISEALVFVLHKADIKMDRKRNVDTSGLSGLLMDAAIGVTDRNTIKSIKVISGTPHPTGSNQDMLDLCR